MPPKIRFTKEQVLETSILIIERDGYSSLTLRSIAKELECSTQPIMSCYPSIDSLKSAAYKKTDEIMTEYCMKGTSGNLNTFLSIGLNYLKFAKEKSKLFRFLYFSNDFDKQDAKGFFDEEAFNFIKENAKLSYDESKKLYECLWFFVHGIATLVSTDSYMLSEQQIEDYLKFSFNAMYEKIISERA